MNTAARKLLAEFVGTFLLVFLAVGAAVFGIAAKVGTDGAGPGNGIVGVALAFGLVLLGIAYAFGPVSGAHVNPAVTLGMLLGRRMPTNEAVGYWIAQFLGAILAGAILKLFVSSFGVTDYTGGLGTNSYDNGAINLAGAFVLEVLLTGAFVLVILLVTERVAPGVVYTTFHHPDTQANVVTTDYSDWATNCPEYKCTAVQVSPSNGRSDWQERYAAFADNSRRIMPPAAE